MKEITRLLANENGNCDVRLAAVNLSEISTVTRVFPRWPRYYPDEVKLVMKNGEELFVAANVADFLAHEFR